MKSTNFSQSKLGVTAVIATIALTALSGCTGVQGNAAPVSTGPSTTTSSTGNVFAGLKACDVLNKSLEGLGFSQAVTNTAGGNNGCTSHKSGYGVLTLTLQPDLGINDLNGNRNDMHGGQIHGRPSIQQRNGIRSEGDCAIAIEVTKTSRALVNTALTTGTTDEACVFIESIANKVEPQLPKGN
jgi:hypothetical protein